MLPTSGSDYVLKWVKKNLGKEAHFSCDKVKGDFGIEFIEPEKTLKDMGQSLIDFGKISKVESKECILL